jgi:hypothetical protein
LWTDPAYHRLLLAKAGQTGGGGRTSAGRHEPGLVYQIVATNPSDIMCLTAITFPVFNIGDATDQMNDSLKQIVGLVAEFQAIGQHSKPEGTPVQ